MAKAAQNAAWCRTFAMLAQLFNVNRDPERAKPIDPMQFYTWGESKQGDGVVRSTEETRAEMRVLFPGGTRKAKARAKGKA
jgi:hypothetical protein